MKYPIYLLLPLAFFTLIVTVSWGGQWHIDALNSIGGWSSLALDSQGYPNISFYDDLNLCLKYAHYNGNNWEIETVEHIWKGGNCNSLALDHQDRPHISYEYEKDSFYPDLKYAYWNGDYWEIEVVDYEGVAGLATCIDLNSQDYPCISYCGNGLKYAQWMGDCWDFQIIYTQGELTSYTSLSLDTQDKPYISYIDCIESTQYQLELAQWNGSNWDISTVDSENLGNNHANPSLELDSENHPNIVYYNSLDYEIKYAYWRDSEWHINTITSGVYSVSGVSLALDNNDYPHISYCEHHGYYGGDYLGYAYWTGSSWNIQTIEALPDEWFMGSVTSIVLDANGLPNISYNKYTTHEDPYWYDGNMMYAWYESSPSIDLLSFSATPKDNSRIALTWQIETTEGEQILGFNLYRREVASTQKSDLAKSDGDQNWQSVNNQLITGQNPYAYIDSDVTSGISYEYRLEAVLADQTKNTLGTCQGTAGLPNSLAITKVYPNPADDYLTCVLSLPQAGEIDLALYDLTGRLVAKNKLEANEPGEVSAELEVSQLASGVYIATAYWNDRQVSKAVIVAH